MSYQFCAVPGSVFPNHVPPVIGYGVLANRQLACYLLRTEAPGYEGQDLLFPGGKFFFG